MQDRSYEQFKRDYYTMTGTMARLAMADKAKKGIYPLRLPIGYKRIFVNGEERIEIDPESGPLVRLAFELAARKRSSLTKVLQLVRARGLKGHSDKPISRSALHRLLTNEFYTGKVAWKGRSYAGVHQALVCSRLFAEVQESLTDRRKSPVLRTYLEE
ncbi:MAG: recombinase family protein [Candidatus Berkelbacteria bacterium]|nr:recombinase family protein [Candidatus Berkelbacteria bacterium]